MMDPNAFAKLVPGFDFLQGLMQSAGQVAPAMGQWVAPTLNPEELDKRIGELKTVQFWLEQNARMISVTIQALEVQRMTLSTLQTMNLPMADLRKALTLPTLSTLSTATQAPEPARKPAISPAPPPTPTPTPTPQTAEPASAAAPSAAAPPGAVDPMVWWGALTQQFTELATKAMHDGGALAARNLASVADKKAATAPAKATPKATGKKAAAKKAAAKPARKRS